MGSLHGFSGAKNAHEPTGTFNVHRSTFNGKPSTINLPTINRFMGSVDGLWSVQTAHEPGRAKGSSEFRVQSSE
jgi:hypothetical protein